MVIAKKKSKKSIRDSPSKNEPSKITKKSPAKRSPKNSVPKKEYNPFDKSLEILENYTKGTPPYQNGTEEFCD